MTNRYKQKTKKRIGGSAAEYRHKRRKMTYKNNSNNKPKFNLSDYRFETLPESERYKLKFENKPFFTNGIFNNMLEFTNKNGTLRTPNKICEWTKDFLTCDSTLFLYNHATYDLYGACFLNIRTYKHNKEEYLVCYVANRCTYNSTGNTDYSSGKLLWAFILQTCFEYKEKNNTKPFIVYNLSISSAVGYHVRMGMKLYKNSEIKNHLDMESITEILDDEYEEEYLNPGCSVNKLLKNSRAVNLFYVQDKNVDYKNIDDIIRSINTKA